MFEAAGGEARQVLDLFWLLLAGAVVIYVLVVGGTWYAVQWRPRRHLESTGRKLILYGGVVIPTVLLAGLAVVSLSLMAELRPAVTQPDIRVTGEQFWWRVEYLREDGSVLLETANRIVLPNGEQSQLELVTADVIHSFWVPALAGKMDMIPGMVNHLVLEPERIGAFRGQCAEFCGESHALMAFDVQVVEPADYRQWLDDQRGQGREPVTPSQRRGQSLFLGYGCGACHRIRGTAAVGRIGPDLTHVGERTGLAAQTLPNDPAAMLSWLSHTQAIKPGVKMPAFGMLEQSELTDIVAYLESLE